jgi:UDP-glucose 4-epimerase
VLWVCFGLSDPFAQDVLVNNQIFGRLRHGQAALDDQLDCLKLELSAEQPSRCHRPPPVQLHTSTKCPSNQQQPKMRRNHQIDSPIIARVAMAYWFQCTRHAKRDPIMVESTSSSTSPSRSKILLVGGCGYIGSFLYPRLKAAGFDITVCDRLFRGNPLGIEVILCDYADLDEASLKQFGSVLWFGGHSSVGQSIHDPNGAVANNCLNLFSFGKKLHPATKLIYASSGSLYSTRGATTRASSELDVAQIPSQNAYDISKFAFDYLAQNFLENFYALRMGTLAGYSANLRQELVFNAMNLSAVRTGEIHLKNSESSRTILFLEDLWVFVEKLLTTNQRPGIFNAGSLSFKMGELAKAIAQSWDAQVIYEGESETYSFLLDTTRMKAICGANLKEHNIHECSHSFIEQCKTARIL